MAIPRTSLTTFSDELSMLKHIRDECIEADWEVFYSDPATSPGTVYPDTTGSTASDGTLLVKSRGEDGLQHIVGNIDIPPGLLQFRARGGVHINRFGYTVGGSTLPAPHKNADNVGLASPARDEISNTLWDARTVATAYALRLAVNRNAIAGTVSYTSGGAPAQGFIYIGHGNPFGRRVTAQAAARIVSNNAAVLATGVAGARQFVLDRNITQALKNTGAPAGGAGLGGAGTPSYPDDAYQQKMMFIPDDDPPSPFSASLPAADYGMVERSPVFLPDTLRTNGSGQTTFEIDCRAGTKLFAAGGRYESGRGAGDIVKLHAQAPRVLMRGEATIGVSVFDDGTSDNLCAWDAMGGQKVLQQSEFSNKNIDAEAFQDPDVISLQDMYYAVYAHLGVGAAETGLVPQVDNNHYRGDGPLYNWIVTSDRGQPDNSRFRINNDVNLTYRTMRSTAMRIPTRMRTSVGVDGLHYGVGPGWG